jgi:UrcA family protein
MFKKTVIASFALAAALSAGWAGQASASTTTVEGFKSQKVSYGDLDISRDRDAKQLVWRIRRAAADVCSISGDTGMDRLTRSYQRCVRTASAKAVAGLNSPMVTAAAEGRSSFELATK